MPSVTLHPFSAQNFSQPNSSPLPQLLQTPTGLAILEIQGTLHHPSTTDSAQTPIGRLVFPLYRPDTSEDDTQWMKKVYLYVGKYQRMTGEVKKLDKALAVVGRRETRITAAEEDVDGVMAESDGRVQGPEELEVKGIVRYRIIFKARPEPVGREEE